MKHNEILRVEGLRKVYRSGSADLVLFDNLSFQVPEGELLAIVGQSGAGKSTLLHMLGALDTPTAGEVIFDGTRLAALMRNPPPSSAIARSAMCGNSTTCCRSLPPWRTWLCLCI